MIPYINVMKIVGDGILDVPPNVSKNLHFDINSRDRLHMKNRERRYFAVCDVFIILIAVFASVIALVSQFNSNADALCCVIKVRGETVETIELSTIKAPVTLEIDGEMLVVVSVTQSSVKVESSACPDKLCEHSGEITRSGQSIVCLPAKVSVTLKSATQQNEFDAVVR